MKLGATDALNVGSDVSVVAIPSIDVGIIDFVEGMLWVIVDCARTMRPAIHDHGEKKPLEVVVAPPIAVEAS